MSLPAIHRADAARLKPLMPPHRWFTVEEANRATRYVGKVAHDVTVTHCQVKSIRCQIEGARGDRLEGLERDYRRLSNRLRDLVRELDVVGVELRDFEKGTVDFPAVVDGRQVFLSWTPGMPAVQLPMAVGIEIPEWMDLHTAA